MLGEEHAIACVIVDYGEVNELSSPADVTDFLLSVVGGFARQAQREGYLSDEWDKAKVGARLLAILKRLQMPEIEVSVPGAGSITVQDLFSDDESFRTRVRAHMQGRVSEVIREVREYAGEIASAILDHDENCAGVALVIDSTEKLAAPGSGQDRMQDAVRNLFVQNGDNLAFPEIHTVYLVPPWLPISDGGSLRMPLLQFPAVRVEHRGTAPEADDVGLAIMDDVLRARMPAIEELVGRAELRELYLMSGGVQRVLFRLLRTVAGRARGATSLPLGPEIIQSAVETIREDYLAVTVEAAPWLARIQENNSLDGLPREALGSLGAYFQAMVVLQYCNGTKWYAIHPLMRERVRRAQQDDG